LYIRQVLYSLADVSNGNTHVIIKKVHHSVEKTIINHYRVKQITENILELNLIKNYLYLVFVQSKYSKSRRKFFTAAIHTKSRDHID
jgi:hypothetical protein